ncbi:MAG TPA: replicative DNA helicase, partial [Phycisphaerae bacterium]|nr:replicative DNA helicase [Phycisphaerae bacterium]
KPIDLVMLREELSRRNQLEQVGGMDYVVPLVEGLPDAGNAEYYARIVRDKALLRELIVAGNEITNQAYESTHDAMEVINTCENRIFKIAERQIGDQAVLIKNLLHQTFETLEKQEGRLITGLASGYNQLDELTSGFQNGEMIILAARPSMGKTSILLNFAEYMAVVDHHPVAVFSMEMSKEQLTQRLLGSHARFNLRQMRRGMIRPEDWNELQVAAGSLEEAPIYIDDTPTLTMVALRAKARRLKAAYDIKCVLVDYLQLMTYGGRASTPRHEQITEISRGIKAMARELEIPVICAAQLNRGPTDRETHRPRMSDLRESGSIEQDADVVALLHCEDYYHQGEESYTPTNVTELLIAKQRNGPVGVVRLTFLRECTRFESVAPGSYVADQLPV